MTWPLQLNVIRWARMTPSDFSVIATGSATPATRRSRSRSLNAAGWPCLVRWPVTCRRSTPSCSTGTSHAPRLTMTSAHRILVLSRWFTWTGTVECCLHTVNVWHFPLVTRRRRIITVPGQNLVVRRNYSRTDQTSLGRSTHIVGDRTGTNTPSLVL